jgi:hypothetical protein
MGRMLGKVHSNPVCGYFDPTGIQTELESVIGVPKGVDDGAVNECRSKLLDERSDAERPDTPLLLQGKKSTQIKDLATGVVEPEVGDGADKFGQECEANRLICFIFGCGIQKR